MKMKRATVAIGFVLLSIAGFSGCGRERRLVEMTELESSSTGRERLSLSVLENEEHSSTEDSAEEESGKTTKMTALADDLEEAEKIADLYGIELDSYSYGVATYTTDKDIQELISFGEENDYPTLAPNYKDKHHTAQ